jgi:hypothetical protein
MAAKGEKQAQSYPDVATTTAPTPTASLLTRVRAC